VVPPSGKTIVFSGDVVILRVKDGHIVEAHEYFDQLAILRQLGLIPGG
jgi:predicted ester cyclase